MLDFVIFAENMYLARKVTLEGYGSELISGKWTKR